MAMFGRWCGSSQGQKILAFCRPICLCKETMVAHRRIMWADVEDGVELEGGWSVQEQTARGVA